jgi:putative transposase
LAYYCAAAYTIDAASGEAALAAFEASPWGQKYPAIGQSWRRAWPEVVPFYAFHPDVRRLVYTTDEIDKRFLRRRGILDPRGRPRGEARRVGCKRRQAAYSVLAELRRSRTSAFDGRVFQRSTKCA